MSTDSKSYSDKNFKDKKNLDTYHSPESDVSSASHYVETSGYQTASCSSQKPCEVSIKIDINKLSRKRSFIAVNRRMAK